MVKTKGSYDRVKHRKVRSDRGKKRKIYAGKKTNPRKKINGNYITQIPKRKRDDPIHVEFWFVRPMSHEGYMNFHKSIRRKMHRTVYGGKKKKCFIIDPSEINNEEKISEFACSNLYDGFWLLMLRGNSKNKYHNSPRAFAQITIKDSPEGFNCKVIPNYYSKKKRAYRSLRKLWWWRGR